MMKTVWRTPPAKVAPYRPATRSQSKAPRSCGELGICQGRTPECKAECAAPVPQLNLANYTSATRVPFCDPEDDIDPDHPDGESNWSVISRWAGLLLGGLLGGVFLSATAGYIYAKWVL